MQYAEFYLDFHIDKFFEKMGFTFSDKNAFPRKLWRECLECPKLEHCDELAYVLDLHYD